jgi:hypothetical protein
LRALKKSEGVVAAKFMGFSLTVTAGKFMAQLLQ